jgi:hypothetical protein
MKGMPGMKGTQQPRRVTVRLTPYQARLLWAMRTGGLPDGAEPRTATEVIVAALLQVATLHGDLPGPELDQVGSMPHAGGNGAEAPLSAVGPPVYRDASARD